MFYPTCYVYKIGLNDENNDPTNKKSDVKKSKISPTSNVQSASLTVNPALDLMSNNTKNENILIKNLSNQLLISAQRNNCIDLDKK
jgi:hypothetical protein